MALYEQYELKLKPLREQLKTLEAQAGVAKAVERAYSGPLFPLHYDSNAAFGTAQAEREREEYFRDNRSYERRGVRDAYFGVADVELRKQLIATRREIERLSAEWQELEARRRQAVLAELKLGSPNETAGWVIAAGAAPVIGAIGYGAAGLPGVVGSVAVAIFLGKAIQSRVQQDAARQYAVQMRDAESELASQEALVRQLTVEGPDFSEDEEHTGERHKDGS